MIWRFRISFKSHTLTNRLILLLAINNAAATTSVPLHHNNYRTVEQRSRLLAFGQTRKISSFSAFTLFGEIASDDESINKGKRNILTSVEYLAKQLAASKFKNVVAVVGAGASVSAGIPGFRTPGTGLYHKLKKYNLPYPEAIFDLDYFRDVNPMPFVDLCQSIWPGQETGPKPTLAHKFLRLLQDKGYLRRIYTQNIDGLESLAGIETDKLVECHGNFRTASCINCCQPIDAILQCRDIIFRGDVPECSNCGSYIKPNIVFFGEELPKRFRNLVDYDLCECDLLLVLGTSLLVMPVAGIPSSVRRNCPRILLNRELVGDFDLQRDVFMEGDCDDSVKEICKLTGWENDLQQL